MIGELLSGLRALLDDLPADEGGAELLDKVDAFLWDRSWFEVLAQTLLDEYTNPDLDTPPFRGLFRDGGADPLVPFGFFEHPKLRVVLQSLDGALLNAIRAADGEAEAMVFSGQHAALRLIGPGSVTIEVYRTEPFSDSTDFVAPRVTWHEPPSMIVEGDELLPIGRHDGFRLLAAQGSPLLLLTTTPVGASDVSFHVRREDGAITKLVPSSIRLSPLPFHLSVLHLLGDERAPALAREMMTHPTFFVRWDAMRQLVKMTGTEALGELAAFEDTEANPMVARAAAAVRQYLN